MDGRNSVSILRAVTKRSPVICALVLGACASGTELESPAHVVGEFEGTVNMSTGEVLLRPMVDGEAVGIGTSQLALSDLTIIQDGNPGTGPADTVELVTTAMRTGLAGCGRANSFCGDVTVRSFYTHRLVNVLAQIRTLVPATGFEGFNSDTYTGVDNSRGLWVYGPLAASGGNASRTWAFNAPTSDFFRFIGAIEGDVDNTVGCTTTSCGVHGACTGGNCVIARRVFVTSAAVSANLGGATGADSLCQTTADAATLGGAWVAWISTAASSVSSRITHSTSPYYTLAGDLVAANYTALTSGSLAHAIDRTQTGALLSGVDVWTGTNTNGSANTSGGDPCSGFTATAGNGYVGSSGAANVNWTVRTNVNTCGRANVHLYCFEK